MTTCEKNARYIPFVLDIIKEHWPFCPPITIATDGGYFESALTRDIIVVPKGTWVEVLIGALRQLVLRSSSSYIFLLLEDLCPVRSVPKDIIDLALNVLDTSKAGVIEFSCFSWPFDVKTQSSPGWARYDWSQSAILNHGLFKVRSVPRDFTYYFSVQPGCWRVQYLLAALDAAQSQGCLSPWAFEQMRWEGALTHLIASALWPAAHHGFMFQGRPHRSAIPSLASPVCKPLREQLIIEEFGGNMRYYAWRVIDRTKKIKLSRIRAKLRIGI